MNRRQLSIISGLFLLTFFSISCARYKNVTYLQDRYNLSDSAKVVIPSDKSEEMVLQIHDNIFINIYGVDMGQIDLFEKQRQSTGTFNDIGLYFQGYVIDEEGNIELPLIGKIKMVGLTLKEARQLVQGKINEYIRDAVVEIRLLSYEVTILGEVSRPGTYNFYKRRINLFDALGKAGDINNFGDIRNIMIIRKVATGTMTTELDLRSSEFLQNPNFFLEPGDVIYIRPIRAKMVSINSPSIQIVLSGLTTLLLLLTYMRY